MSEEYALLLPFDTAEPEFVRGVEVGRVWATLRGCATGLSVCEGHSFTMHASNAEMVLRLAEATGHRAVSEEIGQAWLEVAFTSHGLTDSGRTLAEGG